MNNPADTLAALAPCPFCGTTEVSAFQENASEAWLVSCDQCVGAGPPENTKAEAITAWNRRAALSAVEGEAVAWMHEVTSADGDTDSVLSFRKDRIDLALGDGWFSTKNARPLIYGDTAPPPQQAAERSALLALADEISALAGEMFFTADNARLTMFADRVRALAIQPQQAGGEAEASKMLPVVIRGKAYEVPIPVQLRIVALEDALAQRNSKPIGYLRTLNGEPDWSEDCVCAEPGVVMQWHDESDGYSEIALYANPAPPTPPQPDAGGGEADSVMGSRADAETKLVAVWNDYCETMQPQFVPTGRKAEAQREAVKRQTRNRMVDAAALLAWHIANGVATPPAQQPGECAHVNDVLAEDGVRFCNVCGAPKEKGNG